VRFQFIRAVLILAGIHLYINTQNIDVKYKVTDLKIKLAQVRSQNRNLGSVIAQKENLSYIEKVARTKLDMIYPEKINYILPNNSDKNR